MSLRVFESFEVVLNKCFLFNNIRKEDCELRCVFTMEIFLRLMGMCEETGRGF